ncbi:MAG: hypothetical protein LWY06_17970 [Firmicutes bacterium]|nr:hypothetical protein [Bacillota bacterium]
MSFLNNLLKNPIYIKAMYIKKRQESKKKLRIPSQAGYLAILFSPLIILSTFRYALHGAPSFDGSAWEGISYTALAITMFLQLLYFVFKSVTSSFTSYSSEKEMRTYGSLLSSLMLPEDILKGKFFVSFYPLFMELTCFFPLFAIMGILLKLNVYQIVGSYFLNLIVIIFFTLIGLYCSMISNNSSKAHSRAVFIAGFIMVGTLLVDGLIASVSQGTSVPVTVFINPGVALGGLLYYSPALPFWFRAVVFVCPFLMLLGSLELWKVLSFETSRLPEK